MMGFPAPMFGIERAVPSFHDRFTVERPQSGTHDEHGRWQEQPVQRFEAEGSIQAVSEKDLVEVEAGRRTKGMLRIYTVTKLYTASVDGKRQPDVVIIDGERWQVDVVKDWFSTGGYYKAIVVKMGQ